MWWRFIITFLGFVQILWGVGCAPDLNGPQNPELAVHHERGVSVAETSRDSPECRPDNAPPDEDCVDAVDERNVSVGILTIRGAFKDVEIREAGGEILIKNDGDAPVEIPVQRKKEHAKLHAVDERGVLIPIIDKIVAPPGQKRLRILGDVPDIRREGRAVIIEGKKEVAVEVDADSFYVAPTNVPGAPEEMLAVFSFEKNVPVGGSVKVRISVPGENVRLWKFDGREWTPIDFRYVDGWAEYEVVDNGVLDQDPAEGYIVDDVAVSTKKSAKNKGIESINLKATGIKVNVDPDTVMEGDTIFVKGNIWNQYGKVKANVAKILQKWDGTSWNVIEDSISACSFNNDENKTFEYKWSAVPGRFRFVLAADPENAIKEKDELDNNAWVELNVPTWVTIYGDISVVRVLGSGEHKFHMWRNPSNGVVLFYDADVEDLDVDKLVAMESTMEIYAADSRLNTKGNPDCILCRYDADKDGHIDQWHVFKIAGRGIKTPVFYVGKWSVGILWENRSGAKSFTGGDDPIVFVTEACDNQKCPYFKTKTCDYVIEVPSPLKKQFGTLDEIIIRYVEST